MERKDDGGEVKRRTVLQSAGTIASLAGVPAVGAERAVGTETGETHIVETVTEFETDDVGDLPHVDLMSSYAIDTKEAKFYGFSTVEEEIKTIRHSEAVVIGDQFDELPTVVNRGRSSRELPVSSEGTANQFLPVDAPVGFPAIRVTVGDDHSITIESGSKEYTVRAGEEITFRRSSSEVARSNGDSVTVKPKTVIRNHGLLSIFVRDDAT